MSMSKEDIEELRDLYFTMESMLSIWEKKKPRIKAMIERNEKETSDIFFQATEVVIKDMKEHHPVEEQKDSPASGFFEDKKKFFPKPKPLVLPSASKPARMSEPVDDLIDDFCSRREH